MFEMREVPAHELMKGDRVNLASEGGMFTLAKVTVQDGMVVLETEEAYRPQTFSVSRGATTVRVPADVTMLRRVRRTHDG